MYQIGAENHGEIVNATVSDIPMMLTLVHDYWKYDHIEGFSEENIHRCLKMLLSTPHLGFSLVASINQEFVGYLTIVYVFSLENMGLTAEIDEFYLKPDWRLKGIGSKLLMEAETMAAKWGCTNISLQVSASNDESKAFYSRKGYRVRSQFEIMEKDLEQRKGSEFKE